MESIQIISEILGLINNNPILSTVIVAMTSGAIGTGVFSFLRRPKSSQPETDTYFNNSELLAPPIKRPAYSDRMAHVLAEMSDLAYFEFEGEGGAILNAVENFQKLTNKDNDEIKKFLESFTQDLMGNRALNTSVLEKILKASYFELIDTINVGEVQGFACKYVKPNEPSYVVIAFRGTEKKISDWLTDVDAVPTVVDKTKVHSGFNKAFNIIKDQNDKTAKDRVEEIMKSQDAKDANGVVLPLFIAGHSLGGALALLATKHLAFDITGACYTFGAPRVANYEYFDKVKTPVYRVVNSSDIVPRVPPGAGIIIFINLFKLMSWLTKFIPVLSTVFEKIENFLDKLNGYRHIGDMRYLTDVASNKFETVKLLSNPPAIDRVMWLWQHLAASLFFPVSSHSMKVYRKKLLYIAYSRNS